MWNNSHPSLLTNIKTCISIYNTVAMLLLDVRLAITLSSDQYHYSPSPYWHTPVNTAEHIAHVDTVASTAYIGWHIDIGARDYAPCRQYHNICESTVILASLQISKHVSLFITLSYLSNIVFSPLNLKHRETHGCLVSTVATDALVLKHQAISILSTD